MILKGKRFQEKVQGGAYQNAKYCKCFDFLNICIYATKVNWKFNTMNLFLKNIKADGFKKLLKYCFWVPNDILHVRVWYCGLVLKQGYVRSLPSLSRREYSGNIKKKDYTTFQISTLVRNLHCIQHICVRN